MPFFLIRSYRQTLQKCWVEMPHYQRAPIVSSIPQPPRLRPPQRMSSSPHARGSFCWGIAAWLEQSVVKPGSFWKPHSPLSPDATTFAVKRRYISSDVGGLILLILQTFKEHYLISLVSPSLTCDERKYIMWTEVQLFR